MTRHTYTTAAGTFNKLTVYSVVRRVLPSFRGAAHLLQLTVLLGAAACLMHAAPIVSFQVTSLGVQGGHPAYTYTYSLSGIDLLANEELDIRFDPALYGTLSNGKAGPDFSLLLLQPGMPTGSPGDYSALATKDHASLAGTFSVDFTYLGTGNPGSQPFFLYDDRPDVSVLLASGVTSAATTGIPEPGSLLLSGFGLFALLAGLAFSRRSRSCLIQ